MFFDNGRNEYLRISEIEYMSGSYGGYKGSEIKPAVVHMKDGQSFQVEDGTLDHILRQSQPLVPALPGFVLLTYSFNDFDAEHYVGEDTILAWRAGKYRGLDPVIIDSEFEELSSFHGILEPNGRVQTFECSYSSRDEWEVEMKRLADDEIARKQKAREKEDG